MLGPVSTMVFQMTNNAVGSGMGSAGLVGQIMAYQTMVEAGQSPVQVLLQILLLHFIAPAAIALFVSVLMRKKGWIKSGDMKLNM